jgi:hypothetical protein
VRARYCDLNSESPLQPVTQIKVSAAAGEHALTEGEGHYAMYSLTYASSACVQFSTEDLRALLLHSRAKNDSVGITGMLLFKGGNFMQVLEGEESAVRATHLAIMRDPRHTGVIVLLQRTVPSRAFPAWSMAFRDLDSPDNRALPAYDDFLNTPLTDPRFVHEPSASQRLLQIFKRNM